MYDEDVWMNVFKARNSYKAHYARYKNLTDKLLARVASENLHGRQREAVGLAIEHTRLELNIPKREVSTLRTLYYDWKKSDG